MPSCLLRSKRRSGNSGILNRVRLSWIRRTEATSSMFHFMLLLTITVFFLCWFKPLLSSESVEGTILSDSFDFLVNH
jgi:hypothetical protein